MYGPAYVCGSLDRIRPFVDTKGPQHLAVSVADSVSYSYPFNLTGGISHVRSGYKVIAVRADCIHGLVAHRSTADWSPSRAAFQPALNALCAAFICSSLTP